MKSQALQELVKTIFGDAETQRQFQANPDSVMSRFSLSVQEKRAVLSTHARLGLVTAGSPQLSATINASSSWNAPTP